jgi:DNA-binding transcriptional LysR family regulator
VVYQRGLDMLAMRDELLAQIGEFDSLKRGVLRTGVPTVGGDMLFAPVIAEFRRRHPEIRIELIEHGSTRLRDLARGRSRCCGHPAARGRGTRPSPGPVRTGGGAGAARAFAPERTSIGLPDLRDWSFLLFQEGFALNDMILSACRRHGFIPTVAMQSAQTRFIARLVGAGLGWPSCRAWWRWPTGPRASRCWNWTSPMSVGT